MAEEKLAYLTARLRLDYSDLDKAGGKVKTLGDEMKAAADKGAKPLEESVKKVGLSGADIKKVGRDLTVGVTLPLVAAGAASVKLATDFDTTFGQMVGLAGVATDEVDGLKKAVLNLAGKTGQAPNDLAKALYFIRSAGIDGAAAMDALNAAAKGSAIGMGSAESVADAITSAMNAYGPAVLSGSRATDILAAAVREGKAEASAFAPQLGRLLPLAVNLGVSFDQVAGAMAFLSRTSGDAAQSATQVQGIMQALIAPTGDAAQALAGVGLSGEQVRKVIQDKGLVAALRLLDDRFKGNSEQLRKVFGDIQGFQGALSLVQAPAEELNGVLQRTKDSLGTVDDGFKAIPDSVLKSRQSMAEIQADLIKVGETLLPLVADVTEFGATVVGVFDDLPGPVKTATLSLLAVAAAAGPVISIGSKVKDSFGLVQKAVTSLSSSASGLSATMPGVGLAIAGVAAVGGLVIKSFADARAETERMKRAVEELRTALQEGATPLEAATRRIEGALKGLSAADTEKLKRQLDSLGLTLEDFASAANGQVSPAFERLKTLQEGAAKAIKDTTVGINANALRNFAKDNNLSADAIKVLTGNSTLFNRTLLEVVAATQDAQAAEKARYEILAQGGGTVQSVTAAEHRMAEETSGAATATRDLADATDEAKSKAQPAVRVFRDLGSQLDDAKQSADSFRSALDLLTGGSLDVEETASRWEASIDAIDQSLKDNGKSLDITTEKGRANRQTLADAAKAALDHASALIETGHSADEAKGAVVQHTLALFKQLKQFGLTDDQAVEYLKTLGLTPKNIDTAIRLSGDADAKRRAQELLDSYQNLPDAKKTQIQAAIDSGQFRVAQLLLEDLAKPRTVLYRIQVQGDAPIRDGGTIRRKTGGPVPGLPDQPVPAVLHGGEFVLSRDVVDAIKRGGTTIGLGTRQALATGGGSVAGTAVAGGAVHKHYHLAVTTPPMIDGAAVVAEQFARMEVLHG